MTAVESCFETPVVAFESGGVTDIVIDGETGVLVPPGDVAALASALDTLLTIPSPDEAWSSGGARAGDPEPTPWLVSIVRSIARHERSALHGKR